MLLSSLGQYNNLGLFILRLGVAIIFLWHGLPKMPKAKMMAGMINMPAGAVFLLGLVETLSSIGLILGVQTELAALFLSIVMLGALYLKNFKWHAPFTAMNTTGWEFDLILLAANLAILFTGGGLIKLIRF